MDIDLLNGLDIVEDVKRIQEPYKNANRKFHPDDTVVEIGDIKIGEGNFQVIAGPCSVESEEQLTGIAKSVKASGAGMFSWAAPSNPVHLPMLSRDFAAKDWNF